MPDRQPEIEGAELRRVTGVDHPVSYLDAGPRTAAALVLLHSLGTDHRLWRAQTRELARRYRVIAPDLRRTGSADVENQAALAGWVGDLGRVLDDAGVTEVALAGISLGGIQAIAFAAEHPDRVSSLIVADSFVELDPAVARDKIALLAGQARTQGMAALADSYVEDTFTIRPLPAGAEDVRAAIAESDVEAYVAAVEACFTVRIADRLARVEAPTLVLWGDQDGKAPRELSERIAGGIAGARFVVVPGSGHLSNLENAEEFTRLVAQFVSEAARGFVPSGGRVVR